MKPRSDSQDKKVEYFKESNNIMDYSELYISISMFHWKVNISHNWHSGEGTSTSLKQNSIYVECTRLQSATLFMLIMLLSIQRFLMIQQTFATLAVFDKWKFLQIMQILKLTIT